MSHFAENLVLALITLILALFCAGYAAAHWMFAEGLLR